MPFLMSESLSDTVVTYVVLKRLTKPWTDWDAYKMGLIDEKGKKLKIAITFDERAAWTVLDRFMWNLKKIMEKFVGGSRLTSMLTAIYLLRDGIKPHIVMRVKNGEDLGCLSEMTYAKQMTLFNIEKSMPDLSKFKLSEKVLCEDNRLGLNLLIELATSDVQKVLKSLGDPEQLERELLS